MRIPTFSAAVLLGTALAFGVSAQTMSPSRSAPSQSQSKKMSASTYVQKAARGDMFEIQAAKVALDKSKNDDVRNFAQMMVDDHTVSSQKLKQLIKDDKIKVTVPKDLDKKHKDMLDKLKKTSASSFDRAYMQSQIAGHRDMLNLHQSYSQTGDNGALKQFAAETATVVQKHFTAAEQLAPNAGGGQVQRTPDRKNPGTTQGGSGGTGTMPTPGADRPPSGGR